MEVNKDEVVMLVAVYKIGELEVVMECWKMAVCQFRPASCYSGQVENWSAGWKCNSVNYMTVLFVGAAHK
jgi:hypothetical protein